MKLREFLKVVQGNSSVCIRDTEGRTLGYETAVMLRLSRLDLMRRVVANVAPMGERSFKVTVTPLEATR